MPETSSTPPSTTSGEARYLDLAHWPRREAFDFFRRFDKPYFNLCARLDAAPLKAAVKASGVGSFALAYHYLALHLANELEPFRYRLRGDRVLVLDRLWGGATVARPDDSFGFAYLEPHADYATFARAGAQVIAATQNRDAGFEPRVGDDAMVHFTTLPWVHFSSFSHARNWGREDSIPKIAFGRADADGSRLWLPVSVEVHHALMDGVHVGRYFQRMEALLADPQALLAPAAAARAA